MNWVSAIAIYCLFWAITLFMVLPWGIRTAQESGEPEVPGQAKSAPVQPMLRRKLIWTTAISAVFFGLFWLNLSNGWLTLADVPVEKLGLYHVRADDSMNAPSPAR